MVSATSDLLPQYPDERERERAITWLGWIACRDAGRDALPWWGVAALLPAGQVLAARRIAQSVIVVTVATVSLQVMWPTFSPWILAYAFPAYLCGRHLLRQRGARRAPAALPPAPPRAVTGRWPRVKVSAAGRPAAESYQGDRIACVVSGLAWAPAGALSGAMACGWGALGVWPLIVAVHAAGAAAFAGIRAGAYPRLKLAEVTLAAQSGTRVAFAGLLEDAADRGVLRRGPHGYEFADAELRARLSRLGREARQAQARERARQAAREGVLRTAGAGLNGSRIPRISADASAGAGLFAGLILMTLPGGPTPLAAVIVSLVLLGPVAALAAFFAVHAALSRAGHAARYLSGGLSGLSRPGRLAVRGGAAAFAITIGALLLADAGTFLARALAFAVPPAFVAACGLWTAALALRRWRRRPGERTLSGRSGRGARAGRWLRARVPDAIVIATVAAALLVLVNQELLTTRMATALLFPVAATASIRGWIAMQASPRLAVRAAADITVSLLLGGQLVLFLVWLANVLGMRRSEVARLRSVLESAGADVSALLDWRIWVGGYAVLAAASVAFAVWPARLRRAASWFDRLRVPALAAGVQRVLTAASVALMAIVLLAAAGPAAVAPVLARQVHAAYVVALARQFAADGELAAYARVSRAFSGRLVPFPVLVEIVRAVHAKDGPARGEPGATSAEADLARRLGRLQAAALGLASPSLDPAAQAAAGDAGLDDPLRSATDLGRRVAAAAAAQDTADVFAKRVDLAAELAAKAVAGTISIPQVSSSEVVQVITEYLGGLIEDSPLKGVFAAWLEHLPRPPGQQPPGEHAGGQQPPDGATMVVPDPAALALAAQDQMRRQARADGVLPPLTGPFANGPVTGPASVQSAVDLASQARDIQRGGTCTGCVRLPDPREEPRFGRRPVFEP
jgi:hypothetical protein